MSVKAVFDTNIYLSAVIFGGTPRLCLEAARQREFELYVSKTLFLELARTLKDKFRWQEEEIKEVIAGIAKFVFIVSPRNKVSLIKKDLSDNRVLEIAKEINADFIVSGDKAHILPVKKFGNTKIITAADFIKIIEDIKNGKKHK